MATRKKPAKTGEPPAKTPEGRENQMINLAVQAAEEQLRNGTASSAIIVHYLKLGSMRSKVEEELLKSQAELKRAQVDALRSAESTEQLFREAVEAMKTYRSDDADVC